MFKRFISLVIYTGVLLGGAASAVETELPSGVTMLQDNSGFILYRVDGATFDQQMQQKAQANPAGSQDRLVYGFRTLAGVFASDLPQIIKDDIAYDYQTLLSQGVDPAAIDLTMEFVDVTEANKEAAAVMSKAVAGTSPTDPHPDLFGCGGHWHAKSRAKRFDFNPAALTTPITGTGFDSASLTIDPKMTGFISAKVRYSERSNPCLFSIPYRVRFDGVDAAGDLTFNGSSIELNATLHQEADLFKARLFHYQDGMGFLVGVVYVILDFSLDADVGVKASVDVDATVGAKLTTTGKVSFDMYRNAHENDWVERTPTVNTLVTTKIGAAPYWNVTGRVELMPYLELTPAMEAALYVSNLDVLKASANLRVGLPLTLMYKNTSGGVACDTTYEQINSLTGTVEASLDAQFNYWFAFGNWHTTPIGLSLGSNWRSHPVSSLVRPKGVARLIEFKELGFGTAMSMHSPHVYAEPAVSRTLGGIVVGKRECAPWQGMTKYSVNWGDGSAVGTYSIGSDGEFIGHVWPAFQSGVSSKTYPVTVTSVSDEYGRQFSSTQSKSNKSVTVTTTGVAYTPAGVPASLTVYSDEYGNVSASWGAASGGVVESYQLFEATKADYSDQTRVYPETVGAALGTMLKRQDGTYYYRVRACQGPVCGPYRTQTAPVVVRVMPSAPTDLGPDEIQSTGIFSLQWGQAIGNVTSYEIWRSPNGNFSSPMKAWTGLGLSHEFDIHRDADEFYRVRACNGTICSPFTYETAHVAVTYIEDGHPMQ